MKVLKKVRMLGGRILTEAKVFTQKDIDEMGLIEDTAIYQEGQLKAIQKVVSVGPLVRGIEVGDYVSINPSAYAVKRYADGSLKDGVVTQNEVIDYNFNTLDLDGEVHLMLTDRDIEYVVEEFE